jgi:hypothetical protein
MSQERRKLQRKYLVVYSRVFDKNSGKVIGYLSDLTEEGVMIIGEQPIEQNLMMQLRLDLPEVPAVFPKQYIDLAAKVAWCKPDIDPAFYNTGFEFTNLENADREIIKQMIILYEFRHETEKFHPTVSELQDGDIF